jgi:hypothetical protein
MRWGVLIRNQRGRQRFHSEVAVVAGVANVEVTMVDLLIGRTNSAIQ